MKNTNPDNREAVFSAAQKLAVSIYGVTPAADILADAVMRRVVDGCGLLESRTLLARARKSWLGHSDKDFVSEVDRHLGIGQNRPIE